MTLDEFVAKFEARLVLLGLYGIKEEMKRIEGPFKASALALSMPETARELLKEMYLAAQPDIKPHNTRRST